MDLRKDEKQNIAKQGKMMSATQQPLSNHDISSQIVELAIVDVKRCDVFPAMIIFANTFMSLPVG